MPATASRPRDAKGRLLPKDGYVLPEEVGLAPDLPVTQPEFTPVEYWNPDAPNQLIRVRAPGPMAPGYDAAYDPVIRFMGGYFRATEPWQVEVIENTKGVVAFRADSPSDFTCHQCGWVTKSQQAFQRHIDRKHT
jgi:hypothetical protein